jgi:hypothetical protein
MNKLSYHRKHARKRFRQRYNIEVSNERLALFVQQIQAKEAKFIRRTSNTKTVFVVKNGDMEVPVVYSSKHKCIVTALLMEHINDQTHC